MNIIEKQTVKYFHASKLEEPGLNHAQILGWSSTEVQQARFDAILSLANFNGTSVLDIGCGYGDFKARLDQKHLQVDYIGLDHQAAFINYAKQHYKDSPHTWFHEVDFSRCQFPQVDWVVASGVLSYYSADTSYYFDMIQRFYAAAKRGLIFNMLDQDTFESQSLLVAHDKEQILKQCQQLCPNAILKTGYLNDDFTIKMERRRSKQGKR